MRWVLTWPLLARWPPSNADHRWQMRETAASCNAMQSSSCSCWCNTCKCPHAARYASTPYHAIPHCPVSYNIMSHWPVHTVPAWSTIPYYIILDQHCWCCVPFQCWCWCNRAANVHDANVHALVHFAGLRLQCDADNGRTVLLNQQYLCCRSSVYIAAECCVRK